MKKNLILATALLSSVAAMNAVPRFFSDDIFEEMQYLNRHMTQLRREMRAHMPFDYDHFDHYNKEEASVFKNARKALSEIKPEITQDNDNVIIKFTLNDTVDINKITSEKEDHLLKGTIPTSNGPVDFVVTPNYLEVTRRIELKKENKTDKEQKFAYYTDLATTGLTLPHAIDLHSVKAMANRKDKVFTLTFAKKKRSKVAITHS